ncbi:putative ribonuclease H-like domain-containing protein, partial [Tanacetum coccineum]
MPSPSQTFSFPSTSEPVFSVSTSEPVYESPNSQTSQNTQSQQQYQQYHTTTVSNNNAKFPYLKKDEYETWAMKMEYWIMNSDHNLWNIVLNGNNRKKTGRDPKGNIMILPPVSSLPEDHMADFHHLDDARDIWLAVKARFGGNDESKKMRKSMLKQEFSEFRVAITLKTKGGLDYLSFDYLYNKLGTLEIDVNGGSSYDSRGTSAPTHSAFISAASTNSKMSYPEQSHSITFTSASSSPAASSNSVLFSLRSSNYLRIVRWFSEFQEGTISTASICLTSNLKEIIVWSTISAPLQLLHMDLFGPTSIRSIDHKYYSLVVTDDFSRFTWVFFLGTKDETYGILKDLITFIENQLSKKVKAIRCDNRTEFKNSKLIELCSSKGIRRDYNSKLPTMFWTKAVSTACYVLNRVLVTKPHNKTPYELVSGKVPNISHLKPFGCLMTILNTSDHLGKFEGKADKGFIVGYAAHSKAYRVYNLSSKKIEETFNLRYLEDKPNVQGLGTQDPYIHAGTQDDSDSECLNRFSGPKVYEASEMVESNSDYAEELARLQRQEHEAKDSAKKYGFGFLKDTEEHLSQADMVPAGSIDPTARIPAGSIDPAASISAGPAEPFPTVIEPVHADETSLLSGHSLGLSEHSTRFPSPFDLANSISSSSEMEDIY